jgi:hypothetical protein
MARAWRANLANSHRRDHAGKKGEETNMNLERLRLVRLFAGILSAALATRAAAQETGAWISLGPPDVGWVSGVAIADSSAFAATQNGVFRSDDAGITWRPSGLAGEPTDRILARSGAADMFARTTRGYSPGGGILYASHDHGASWSAADVPPVVAVALDPANPANVYATTLYGQFAKSNDAGATWSVSGLPGGIGESVAIGSSGIYVTDTGAGLYRSIDGGATWAARQSPQPGVVAIFAGRSGALYTIFNPSMFCRSTDGAATWTCSPFPAYVEFDNVSIVELGPGGSGTDPLLLAVHSSGILSSADGGATWNTTLSIGTHDAQAPHGLAADGSGALVIAGSEEGVLRSLDRGQTWTASSAGLNAASVSTLAVSPANPSNVWAGANDRLFHSIDGGVSWSDVHVTSVPWFGAIAVDPTRPSTAYVAADRIYRTDDDGASWTGSLTGPQHAGALVIASGSPQTLWAASGDLYKSSDGGKTFQDVGSISQAIQGLLFDRTKPDTVYAGGFYDFVDYAGYDYPQGGSIFVSPDGGRTFLKNARDFGMAVTSIVQDSAAVLYAATPENISRSDDGGATWQVTDSSPPRYIGPLLADPTSPGLLYAGTTDGVYRSIDSGTNWALLSTGLAHSSVTSLAISSDGRVLRAATAGAGVFELDLQVVAPSCVPTYHRLCFLGDRYAVELSARKGDGPSNPGLAHALGDRAGYFSLPFATGDPDLPEVAVKILPDGTFGAPGAPFFYSSLTTLPYVLRVTDTVTGRTETYTSHPDAPLCGGASLPFGESGSQAAQRSAPAEPAGSLSLLGGRFTVTLQARRANDGRTADGVLVASGDVYGIFSLPAITGDATFPEVVVKMIDARSFAGAFWFFQSSLTNLDYTLTVTDSVTGAVRTYGSGAPFCGDADTAAFEDQP